MTTAWRRIETAPKDGTTVLLCSAVDADGSPTSRDCWGISVQAAAWWGSDEGWVVYCSMIRDPSLHFDPTHWMPLPEPPKSRAIREEQG